ncbi:hypothetical protein TrRE_jg1333 [Triparma retinervis]|uniref:Uncharacterized protein n=1 Tax=Triparma retinervis TaxID=2557542 RepID=A0A9W7FZT0_9STRA|nr:hypothetical protein TrRE_jg1333 [Triparma retinervis]
MIPALILTFGTHVLQSEDSADDKQWLTFWLLFSLFEVGVSVLDLLAIYIVPFYGEIKFGFILFLGVFGGAGKVYPLLEPFLLQAEKVAEKYEALAKEEVEKAKKKLK